MWTDIEKLYRARPPVLRIMPQPLRGVITPPASKSCAHRALICAALVEEHAPAGATPGRSQIIGLGEPSADIRHTIEALRALRDGENTLDCGESGTTLRLLIPVAAALGRQVVFVGRGRLGSRPIREYEAAFAGHGAKLELPPAGSLPLRVHGRLQPGRYEVPGHVSSQYVSGLLLALPLLPGDSRLVLTSPLESAPYVDLTLAIQRVFGVDAQPCAAGLSDASAADMPYGGYEIAGDQTYRPALYEVEADYSQAAFWLAANRLGSRVEVRGLPVDSHQGDRAIVTWLRQLAALGAGETRALTIDASQIPDLVPVLAAVAACTPGPTRIVRAQRLRLKESDRLASIADGLSAIGAAIRVTADGLRIDGRAQLAGGTADAHNDHRIAMALAVAALGTREGVAIRDPWCVDKSYPAFYRDWVSLGGVVS